MRRRLLAAVTAGLAVVGVVAAVPAPASAAPPRVSVLEPAYGPNGWATAPFSVILRVQGDHPVAPSSSWRTTAGDQSQTGRLNAGDTTVQISREGETTVSWDVLDTETERTTGERRVKLDLTDPVVQISSPPGQVAERGGHLGFFYSCSDAVSGIATCRTDQGRPTGESLDTSTVGPHTVTVTATDGAGRTTSQSYQYTVVADDTHAPTAVLTHGGQGTSNGWFTEDGPWLDVVATDPVVDGEHHSGVSSVHAGVDGTEVLVGENHRFTVHGEGRHAVTAYAVDGSGNTSSTATYEVKIDTVDPTADVTYPRAGQVLTPSSSDDVVVAFEDATSGVLRWSSDVDPGEGGFGDPTGKLDLSVGDHLLWLVVEDGALNGTVVQVRYRVVADTSRTGLAVPAPHGRRATATVRVTSPLPATGRVALYDGHRRVSLVRLPSRSSATSSGRVVTARILLPRLTRGRHALKAVYLGAPDVGRSTSRTVVVRVR